MVKTLESLSTLHRFLILVAATLIVVAVNARSDPFRFTHALQRLDEVERQYRFLQHEMSRLAPPAWRAMLTVAREARPEWLSAMLVRAPILPALLWIEDASQPLPWTLSLGGFDTTLAEMLALPVVRDARAYHPMLRLNTGDIGRALDEIGRERRAMYEAADLTIFVVQLQPGGTCELWFRSLTREKEGEPPQRWSVGCEEDGRIDRSDLLRGLFEANWQVGNTPIDVPPEFAMSPYPLARAQLNLLAAREAQRTETEIDVLGPKLSGATLLGIGPVVVIAVLLVMLAHVRSLSGAPRPAGDEPRFWLGLFLGWPILVMVLTTAVLPTLAVAAATAAVHVPHPSLAPDLPWHAPALLWDQRGFIGYTAATAVLSSLLVFRNWRAAHRWQTEPTTPAALVTSGSDRGDGIASTVTAASEGVTPSSRRPSGRR
jgi:hypothetical protein